MWLEICCNVFVIRLGTCARVVIGLLIAYMRNKAMKVSMFQWHPLYIGGIGPIVSDYLIYP